MLIKNKPLVSIIMPVYNSDRFLRTALQSTLAQTYKNIEIICVDDGSNDNSSSILEEFLLKDTRVKVYTNPQNKGIGYSTHLAISLASGQYIARMDADDIMTKHRIEKQVNYLIKHPKTVMVGGQCSIIDENGIKIGKKTNPTQHKKIYEMMFTNMSIQGPTLMFNKSLVPEKILKNDSSILKCTEDLDLVFRLSRYGKMANLPDTVLNYRIWRESNTARKLKKVFFLTLKVRVRAIVKYGYKPSIKSVLLCLLQSLVVPILPNSLAYALYLHQRGIKKLSSSIFKPKPLFSPKAF